MKRPSVRLDKLLVDRGLAPSRERAQALILAGKVTVDGSPESKAGRQVPQDALVELRGEDIPYVSRGGLKLEHALDAFAVDVAGLVAMDVGASTGGFADCLLQRDAKRVYAVDVGYGQLDWKLRNDPRVVVIERQNIRTMPRELVPEPIRLATIDASFISLKLVIPAVMPFLDRTAGSGAVSEGAGPTSEPVIPAPVVPAPPATAPSAPDPMVPDPAIPDAPAIEPPVIAPPVPGAMIIALIKPQFEAGREHVGKGGVVRDPRIHEQVCGSIVEFVESLGLHVAGVTPSPILGPKGNREFLLLARLHEE